MPAAGGVVAAGAPERRPVLARGALAGLAEHLLVPLRELVVLLVLREGQEQPAGSEDETLVDSPDDESREETEVKTTAGPDS